MKHAIISTSVQILHPVFSAIHELGMEPAIRFSGKEVFAKKIPEETAVLIVGVTSKDCQQIHQEWSQKCSHIPLILILEEDFHPDIAQSDTLGILQSKNLHDSIVTELHRLKITQEEP